MKSMVSSLSQSIDKVSEIDKKVSQSVDKVSEIDQKISHAALIKNFPITYQLCNKDLNKFALLLRKGVWPYEYMDSWNKFNEPVPLVEDHYYYSELNKEGITKEDLKHVIIVCDTFKIKKLRRIS